MKTKTPSPALPNPTLPPGYKAGAAVSGTVITIATGIGKGATIIGRGLWGFAKGVARVDVSHSPS